MSNKDIHGKPSACFKDKFDYLEQSLSIIILTSRVSTRTNYVTCANHVYELRFYLEYYTNANNSEWRANSLFGRATI